MCLTKHGKGLLWCKCTSARQLVKSGLVFSTKKFRRDGLDVETVMQIIVEETQVKLLKKEMSKH